MQPVALSHVKRFRITRFLPLRPPSPSTVPPVRATAGPPAVRQVRPAGSDEKEAAAGGALHHQE